MRVGFTLIGGKSWTGGYNYLLNLVQVLAKYQEGRITPVLFFGTDIAEDEVAPFANVQGTEIIHSPFLNQANKSRSLASALFLGADFQIRNLFRQHKVDVVFESAQFFGWQIGLPVIAWMPDFQHQALPEMFTRSGYWKRELGFRAQTSSKRTIMLSSEDSRSACEHYYPSTKGNTHVVRFAIPPRGKINFQEARAVADSYNLPEKYFFLPNQFCQHKNHMLVLDALALLRERGHSVVIATSGQQVDPRHPRYFSQIQQRRSELALENEFRLLGMIPYNHLVLLMYASMALLNPSRFEGWSTTVEEAQSIGVPMLLSNLPVHREQMGEKANYFDVLSASSLADTLQKFQPRKQSEREECFLHAQKNAVARVQRFSHDFASLVEHAGKHWPAQIELNNPIV